MRYSYMKKVPLFKRNVKPFVSIVLVLLCVMAGVGFVIYQKSDVESPAVTVPESKSETYSVETVSLAGRINPLKDKKFYVNNKSAAALRAEDFRRSGNIDNAVLIEEISAQPAAVWLTGPSTGDPTATRDIREVERISAEAGSSGAVPLYELYAIPNRDACAGYSSGGFANSTDYLVWVERILDAVSTPSIFSVEADAVSQTIDSGCMSGQQKEERYQLINQVVQKLSASPNAAAIYIDAGHPEWFPDPAVLVEPLQKSGIANTDGVSVNVSNFVATNQVVEWSSKLVQILGGSYGVVVDTSRNGRGATPMGSNSEERWCNPRGRGLGNLPTTSTGHSHIDAYFWIKAPGESDGSCFGFPPAGQFIDEIAFELARNSLE